MSFLFEQGAFIGAPSRQRVNLVKHATHFKHLSQIIKPNLPIKPQSRDPLACLCALATWPSWREPTTEMRDRFKSGPPRGTVHAYTCGARSGAYVCVCALQCMAEKSKQTFFFGRIIRNKPHLRKIATRIKPLCASISQARRRKH